MSQETRIIEMKQKGDLNGLVKIIKNDDEWMSRMDAAEALAQLGDKRGLNYLINALDDADIDIRDVAREILEGLNDPRGNQALQKPREFGKAHSQPDNSSKDYVDNKAEVSNEPRLLNKRKPRDDKSYSRTAIIIIVIAGILIFIDSFSWSNGGMNGLLSMMVGMIAVIALIAVTIASASQNIAQTIKETKLQRDYDRPNTSGAKPKPQSNETRYESQKTHDFYLPIFVLVFGFLGAVTGYYLAFRENSGADVRWENIGHPGNLEIIEISALNIDLVKVKANDGNIYKINLESCQDISNNSDRKDCWNIDINGVLFNNEWIVNDQSCPGKSRPPHPPLKHTAKDIVFRNCPRGTTREMRLFLSDDGNLWFWIHFMTPTPRNISLTFALGLLGIFIGIMSSKLYAQKDT